MVEAGALREIGEDLSWLVVGAGLQGMSVVDGEYKGGDSDGPSPTVVCRDALGYIDVDIGWRHLAADEDIWLCAVLGI